MDELRPVAELDDNERRLRLDRPPEHDECSVRM
jgi:hypothetical protein